MEYKNVRSFMCLPKKVTKNKNKNHSMGLNADYKLAQHTCSSWYSGRRCAACLVWPVLVVASSVVQPPVQLRPSDQQDAWRPERTSNPVMETHTHTEPHTLCITFMSVHHLSVQDGIHLVFVMDTMQKHPFLQKTFRIARSFKNTTRLFLF